MKHSGLVAVIAAAIFVAVPASAPAVSASRIGTPSSGITSRSVLDLRADFAIVDTGQPATQAGTISEIEYFAQATGTVRFLLVDNTNTVVYETGDVSVTSTGAATFTLPSPVSVAPGWKIGYYTQGTGVIPFDSADPTNPSSIEFSGESSGPPTVGQQFPVDGTDSRTYSLGADVTSAPPLPTSKDQCKNGGWKNFGVFKNEGDCVSFVATHGKNGPNG